MKLARAIRAFWAVMTEKEGIPRADADRLTGLYTKEAAERKITAALENGGSGALLVLDLDRFRNVNLRLGEDTGDKLLKDTAAELMNRFRNTDVLCRTGEDEFLIWMQNVQQPEWTMNRARMLLDTLHRWIGNGLTSIPVSGSIGIAFSGSNGFQELYRMAGIAMYCAKAAGGNRAMLFTEELREQLKAAPPAAPGDGTRTIAEMNGMEERA